MEPITDLALLLRSLAPVLHPDVYAFVSLPEDSRVDAADLVASIREPEGLSIIVERAAAERAGLRPAFLCRWVTLTVPSDLTAIGLTAAVARVLADARLSCNVVAGTHHDHLFVPADQADAAMAVLERLQASASAPPRLAPRLAPALIRLLDPSDVVAFRDLRLLALSESPTAFGTSVEDERAVPLASFAARLTAGSLRRFFGAFHGDVLGGMVGLVGEAGAKERHRLSLRSMYVHPDHRGRGLGRALVAHALAVADADAGVRQVTLAVTAGNSNARALYEAFGFTVYGVAPSALFVDGTYYDDLLMVRTAPQR